MERHLTHEVKSHHHHSCDPEEDDVKSRHQHICRVVTANFWRLVRPAKCRKRPQSRREPGIEHVFVAGQRGCLAIMRFSRRGGGILVFLDEHRTIRAIPRRDLVAPPQLSRNAPGLDITHPVEVGFFPMFRHELCATLFDRSDSRGCKRRSIGIPLIGQKGFDRHPATISIGYRVGLLFNMVHEPQGLQVGDHTRTRFKPVQAAIGSGNALV